MSDNLKYQLNSLVFLEIPGIRDAYSRTNPAIVGSGSSLDVLDLLPHLFDQHLKLDRGVGHAQVGRFGT